MDVTRSVASPSDDIKAAAVFEKDALLSAQTMIYDDGEMKKTLPGDVYERFKATLVDGGATSDEDQEAISKALYAWARERGATDYAHWFFPMRGGSGATLCGNQPVCRVRIEQASRRWRGSRRGDSGRTRRKFDFHTGATGGMLGALKCDAFIDLDWSSDAANKPFKTLFPSGRLYTGETDGSSFPNGGLRATHTAAAFTSWDRSSPCFVYDKVLRIPCAFVTHYGRAIDDKTPLLRSQDAVAREGLRLLKACGVAEDATTMYAYLGWEQEFFVVSAELYKKRPDLVNAGRTLFGRLPPRHQSGDLNYFGATPGPVEDLLIAVQTEMMRMGSPMVRALCGNQPAN